MQLGGWLFVYERPRGVPLPTLSASGERLHASPQISHRSSASSFADVTISADRVKYNNRVSPATCSIPFPHIAEEYVYSPKRGCEMNGESETVNGCDNTSNNSVARVHKTTFDTGVTPCLYASEMSNGAVSSSEVNNTLVVSDSVQQTESSLHSSNSPLHHSTHHGGLGHIQRLHASRSLYHRHCKE